MNAVDDISARENANLFEMQEKTRINLMTSPTV
jgi:hypothetical protein